MTEKPLYQFIATMNVQPEKESLFNEIYDKEHIPHLMRAPGMRLATRLIGMPGRLGANAIDPPSLKYMAIFEIDSPEVLTTPSHAAAVEAGRWANEIRPYTSDRTHRLFKVISRHGAGI